jgi:2',3'-cyclic-nucleotide 2'-phosphodiesterase/3'-nucleotidase
MTGKQLKDWMEYSVRYYDQTTGDNAAVIKDPILNIPDYNLDQLYGATYDIDLTQPACTIDKETGRVISGNRIKNLKVNGVEVKDSDEFTVAINNYRFNGGGGFMKAAGLSNTDSSIIVYDSGKALGDDGQVRSLMTSYIKKHGEISPDCSNNWEILNVDKQKKAA